MRRPTVQVWLILQTILAVSPSEPRHGRSEQLRHRRIGCSLQHARPAGGSRTTGSGRAAREAKIARRALGSCGHVLHHQQQPSTPDHAGSPSSNVSARLHCDRSLHRVRNRSVRAGCPSWGMIAQPAQPAQPHRPASVCAPISRRKPHITYQRDGQRQRNRTSCHGTCRKALVLIQTSVDRPAHGHGPLDDAPRTSPLALDRQRQRR
jgi:hypothetical protein